MDAVSLMWYSPPPQDFEESSLRRRRQERDEETPPSPMPHPIHALTNSGASSSDNKLKLRRMLNLVFAVTLHNAPGTAPRRPCSSFQMVV